MLSLQKQCPNDIEYEPRVEEVELDLAHATFLIDQGGVEDVVERFARNGSIGFRSTGWL
jgi:hypothetical protein